MAALCIGSAAALMVACGSDRLPDQDLNGGNPAAGPGSPTSVADPIDDDDQVADPIDADDRVADLTNAQIREICADVEPYSDLDCGTDPETGEPFLIGSDMTKTDCEEAFRDRRDGEDNCRLALAVAECWSAEPCERALSDTCNLTCPERAECYQRSVEECTASEWCYVEEERRLSSDGSCYESLPAYCAPTNRNCSNSITTALDPGGRCWLMGSICELPKGWENEPSSDERTCPYVGEVPACG